MKRVRGLVALISRTVEHGAASIEHLHLETAGRPFRILEQVPGIAGPAAVIHGVHDLFVRFGYGSVRAVARTVGVTTDAALAIAAKKRSDRRNGSV